MDHGQARTHAQRPTSGASAAELIAQLRETRLRTRRLTEDLSSAELLGPYREIVNPVLWELGHIAWFHEYWTLRGAAPSAGLAFAVGDNTHEESNPLIFDTGEFECRLDL